MIIRRATDGACFLVLGGRGARLLGGGNLEALAAADVKTANVTADQYAILEARYLEIK